MSDTDPSFRTGYDYSELKQKVASLVWNPSTLSWVKMTQPGGSVALNPSAPSAASVGVTSAQAVAANANRTGLVLVNTSANNISFGIGQAAVLNSGITLTPNGVWEMDAGTFNTGAIYAIASAGSSNLAIQEFS